MNGDLISRSALLEKAVSVTEYDEGGWGFDFKAVPEVDVLKAPAVDAEQVFEQMGLVKEAFEMAKADLVAVVRCKDCKCGKHPGSTELVGKYVCCALYDPMPLMRISDFCSYGERKGDHTDFPCDADLEHMTRFAMLQAFKNK